MLAAQRTTIMQKYEITVDGTAQPTEYATQAEADAAATNARQASPGKTVAVRAKPDAEPHRRAEQGTPGNPAGSPQR